MIKRIFFQTFEKKFSLNFAEQGPNNNNRTIEEGPNNNQPNYKL